MWRFVVGDRNPTLPNRLGTRWNPHTACQKVGGAVASLGCDAILVPSARGHDHNLVIFADQQEPDAPIEILESMPIAD